MISIRRYLYGRKAAAEAEPDGDGLHRFCAAVLGGIHRHVLGGEGCRPLRSQLELLKESLQPDFTPEEALRVENALSGILTGYHGLTQQTATAQAIEMQHIFAMLNEALIVLAEGRDRSVSRLNKIQESLRRASMIEDIVALKTSLADTVRFVRQESVDAHEAATQELGRFETEVTRAREFIGNARVELTGRSEAVERITAWLQNPVPGQTLYLVAYLFDQLRTVTQRFGPAVGDELIFRLIKERVHPIAAAYTTYRWTFSAIVAVFPRLPLDLPALRAQVANLNRTPMVHRSALGNRTAVLTVTPSHLIAEGAPGDASLLIEQVDKFAGVEA